ncbi:MAG: hypothetical protein ACHP7O_13615 [Burkholderiales bacterium]
MDDAKQVDSWNGPVAAKCFIKLPLFSNSPLQPVNRAAIEGWFILYTPDFQSIFSTPENGFLNDRHSDGRIIVPGPFFEEKIAIEAVVEAAKLAAGTVVLPP